MVGVPLPVEHEAQDALEFFKRQKELDTKVAAIMNEHHKRVIERLNASIKEPEEFNWGNLVWFLRSPLSRQTRLCPGG